MLWATPPLSLLEKNVHTQSPFWGFWKVLWYFLWWSNLVIPNLVIAQYGNTDCQIHQNVLLLNKQMVKEF